MPLTRTTVTVASRVMLPTHVLVNVGYGLALIAEPSRHLLTVPAYRTLDAIAPIHAWGWLFILAGAAQLGAMTLHRRYPYVYALGVGLAIGGLLTVALVSGAVRDTNPWTAPWFPLFYTAGCWASIRSLVYGEH